jgi:butyrate kinase
MKVLVINPLETSTKVALFQNHKELFLSLIYHDPEEIAGFDSYTDQVEYRLPFVIKELEAADLDISEIDVIVGKGALVKPVKSGVYKLNPKYINDLRNPKYGEVIGNLSALLVAGFAKTCSKENHAFVAQPSSVDEMHAPARVTGLATMQRESKFHALNQKTTARLYAQNNRKKYEELNLIVAHMGLGVSVALHKQGKVLDLTNSIDGEGPMSAERSGTVPVGQFVELCFSGKYTEKQIYELIRGKGGLYAYLSLADGLLVEEKINKGDEKALLVYKAMALQVAKEIGALATVNMGEIDAIILTGGFAYSERIVNWISENVSFIANVVIYPGEDEMKSLYENVFNALNGDIPIHHFE